MNNYLLVAGVLAILLGLAHSVFGEILVFRRLRVKNNFSWISNNKILPLRAIRILWASWHIVTIFGFGFGAILLRMSLNFDHSETSEFILNSITISTFLASTVVLVGTQGKHPGWLVLLSISVLTWCR